MKKFYISSFTGLSGICKYSQDFYHLILQNKGYEFIDSGNTLTDVMTAISSRDKVHIEIGIFQNKEIEILFSMLNSGYRNVSVTLHDAPLLKYPFHSFDNIFLNKLSKFYDQKISRFKQAGSFLSRIQSIYVLSKKGMHALRQMYHLDNVFFLPHVIHPDEIDIGTVENNNLIYFGFIGRNKKIEYCLKLHQQLLEEKPEIEFNIVGEAIGKETQYYNYLQNKYSRNVNYLGYLPDKELKNVFNNSTFAMLMFNDYKFFWPFSGSILYSLKKGKIVLTNDINTTNEIIQDHANGYLLSGHLQKDKHLLLHLMNKKEDLTGIVEQARAYLNNNHSVSKVIESFKD